MKLIKLFFFWGIFGFSCVLLYQAAFPSLESMDQIESRAKFWCEEKLGPQPPKSKHQLELTKFDDCVDAEVRLYAGSKFGVFISGIIGGVIVAIYVAFWGVRFTWKRYRRHKQIKQNPYS